MTKRILRKPRSRSSSRAGKAPGEIAEILGVVSRYAVAVARRMRNPETAKWRGAETYLRWLLRPPLCRPPISKIIPPPVPE